MTIDLTKFNLDPNKHMETKGFFGAGMYIKQCLLPPGFTFAQHRHKFDHLSILAFGTAIIEVDGVKEEHTGPKVLTIKAKKIHSVTPLTPVGWFCCHASEETDEDKIDHELIA